MKPFTRLALGSVFGAALLAALPAASASAAPIGALIGVSEAGRPVVEQVQARRRGSGRVVRRGRGGDAALAAGLIGAAVVGGAIIAQSQRGHAYERSYYYGDGEYYGGRQGYYAQPEYYAPPRPRNRGYYDDSGLYVPRQPYVDPYGHYPRHNRTVRDPAGGGRMQMGGP